MTVLAKLADKIIYQETIRRLKRFFSKSGKSLEYGQVIFNFHQGKCVHIDYLANARIDSNKLFMGVQ